MPSSAIVKRTGRGPVGITIIVAGMLAAAALLTLALAHHNVWPTLWVRASAEVSVEAAAFLLLLALWREARGPLSRGATWVLAAVVLAFVVGRYIDVTAPAVFGRRINLYWDLMHLPSVFQMLNEAMPTGRFLLGLALGATALAVVAALSVWIVRRIDAAYDIPVARRGMAAVATGLIAVYAAGMLSDRNDAERFFAIPISPVYAKQAVVLARNLAAEDDPRGFTGTDLPPSNLAGLDGSDVFVIFLESYGAIAYEDAARRPNVMPKIEAAGTRIAAAGWHTASALMTAPTFGGASWLSHGSFLSGLEIREQAGYNRLLASGRETLVDRFRTAGYRTAALFPGVKRAWPEGAAYRFDRIYDAKAIDYRGPAFGWWTIPDQASLARLHAAEFSAQGRARPLFLFFPTISSHMPFEPVPPYQPDWSRLASATPYDAKVLAEALSYTANGKDLQTSWERAVRYDFDWVAGYVTELAPRSAILIVMGDHQPPGIVSGQQASWRVPVHVIARDPARLEAFLSAGFRSGMVPAADAIGGLEQLSHIFLRAFDRQPKAVSQRKPAGGG